MDYISPFLIARTVLPLRLPMSLVQQETLSTEIDALLLQGIIVHREYGLGDCVSPVFTTSKSDGSHRFILRHGHASVIYLDDGYLQASTYEECCRNIQCTTSLLEALGFFISDKSVLTPTTRLIFLGFILDSDAMTITLTEKRKGKILSAAKVMASAPTQRIRAVAALVGMIIAALPGVTHGQLHYRRLERDKNIALLQTNSNFNKNMTLSAAAVRDIIWWYTNISVSSSFIHPPLISHYLYTDASLAGWGATDSQLTAGGVREEEDVPPAHINVLELRAAYLALQSLCQHCVDSHVCLYMDNSTAVAYINKKGGTHSVLCDALAVKIWQWAIPRNIWLSAVFYPWRIECSSRFLLSVSN